MSSVAAELMNKIYKIIHPEALNPLDRTKSRKRPAPEEVPSLTRKLRRVSDFSKTYPAVLVEEPRRTYVIPVEKPFRSRFTSSGFHKKFLGVFGMSKYSKGSRRVEPDYADIEYSDDDEQEVIYVTEKVPRQQQQVGTSSSGQEQPQIRNNGAKPKMYMNGGTIDDDDDEEDNENRRQNDNRPRMIAKSPPFLTRGALMLSRVPGLHPIDRSRFKPSVNTFRQTTNASPSILQNGSVDGILKWGNKNLFDLKNCTNLKVNNLSSSSAKSPLVKTNLNSIVTKTMNLDERHKYFDLLKSCAPDLYNDGNTSNISKISGHDRSTQKAKLNVSPSVRTRYIPIEIPDDDDVVETSVRTKDATRSPNVSSKPPDVTPVNSLRNKFLLRAEFQDGWLSNISKKYDVKEQQRKEDIIQQTESLQDLTHNTRQNELDIQKKLQDVCIASDIIQIDDSSESEVEVCEFPELSNDDKKLIEYVSRNGPSQEVIIDKFNLRITRRDLATLVGLNWLNDEVINFYMNLLNERSEQLKDCGYPSVYSMNTFFVPRLMQAGHSGVRRWTRKVNIFSYDIIPVPVHVGQVHWCMAIIHLKDKTIKYYDSMGTPNPAVLRSLETYLKDESLDKLNTNLSMNDWEIESVRNLPRQMNGSDCGVFSCMFAEYITRNKPITFSQENMVYFRQKMIFEIAKGKLLT